MFAHPCPTSRSKRDAKYRLLYIGGDAASVSALRRALGEPEFQIVTCSDLGSAVLFLKSQIPYTLLVLDSGDSIRPQLLELATLVRSLRRRKKMPIVFATSANLTKAARAQVLEAGVNECVGKSEEMMEVAAVIKARLKRPGKRNS